MLAASPGLVSRGGQPLPEVTPAQDLTLSQGHKAEVVTGGAAFRSVLKLISNLSSANAQPSIRSVPHAHARLKIALVWQASGWFQPSLWD